MSAENDFRSRAGLPAWRRAEELAAVPDLPDGRRWRAAARSVTRIAGEPGSPGRALITTTAWLLLLLGAGVAVVSFAGQYAAIFAARGGGHAQVMPSRIESGMLDAGMVIFALLGLGLAFAGKTSRTERALVVACALGSAAMGYAAADATSPRSVAAFVAPPVFLAVVVDRVIAVVRRHRLGETETSPWVPLGRASLWALRAAGVLALYLLRLLLDPHHTIPGLRRVVLNAAPLPERPVKAVVLPAPETPELPKPPPQAPTPPAVCTERTLLGECGRPLPCKDHPPRPSLPPVTKKNRLLELYRAHPAYGDRSKVSQVADELYAQAGLAGAGTARTYIGDELTAVEAAQAAAKTHQGGG